MTVFAVRRRIGPKMSAAYLACVIIGLSLTTPARSAGQSLLEMDVRGAEVSRPELIQLLERLEAASVAPGYSEGLRDQAAREASYVRERLEQGDFRVGDQVALLVRGEPTLSDTLTVTGDRALDLPQIGPVSLRGVLRSELESHLREALGRYLRDPDIRAQALIRIAVLGQVGSPGFYALPSSSLLEDALMTAGGPATNADMDNIRVRRGEEVLWEGSLLQLAMVEGRTLDQLSLRAGDRIVVPSRRPGLFEGGLLRTLLVTIPPIVFLIARLRIF